MRYLPLFHDFAGVEVLLVGGGNVALRKAELLAAAGARLRVVAPEIDDRIVALSEAGGGSVSRRAFEPADLTGVVLVIAATGDPEVNAAVAGLARARSLMINVVDDARASNVIFGSLVDRDPVIVALSSAGRSPVLLRLLRERIETLLPGRLGDLAEWAGGLRERVKAHLPDADARRRFWERLLAGPAAEAVLAGRGAAAARALEAALDESPASPAGEVYLVGAGPGDPDLLTLRALHLMQRADVVLYDNLVSDAILTRTRRDAERIYVGKRRAFHAARQQSINEMLVEFARAGKRVVRLKGGDPFVFGRGGEEIATLAAHRIDFQVVPGITAANGCAAYAGIPLTHRDYAQAVHFVTAVTGPGSRLDWRSLAQPGQTLVFYMGLAALPEVCAELINHGRSKDTPAALIERGTLPDQRVLRGTLADLPAQADEAELAGPTLIIVGEVVAAAAELGTTA